MKFAGFGVASALTASALFVLIAPYGCGGTVSDFTPGASGSGGEGNRPGSGGELSSAGGEQSFEGVVPCATDKVCRESDRLCDLFRNICVECRDNSDCSENQECSLGVCESRIPCDSSKDCPVDQVCSGDGYCVECVSNADCGSNEVCGATECHLECDSSKDCRDLDEVCDQDLGYCLECAIDADCENDAHCESGACIPDVCEPGDTLCLGASLLTCGARGAGYDEEECESGCSRKDEPHCVGEPAAGGASGTGGTPGAGATGGSGGAGGAGGAMCPETPDTVQVPSCGTPAASSSESYSGVVTITVSGYVEGASNVYADAFYVLDSNDLGQSTESCPQCFVFNRASEGNCACPSECPATSHKLSDFLVDSYPAFRADHTYTFQVDLGSAAAEQLNFGFGDCGCDDNSGTYNLTLECE